MLGSCAQIGDSRRGSPEARGHEHEGCQATLVAGDDPPRPRARFWGPGPHRDPHTIRAPTPPFGAPLRPYVLPGDPPELLGGLLPDDLVEATRWSGRGSGMVGSPLLPALEGRVPHALGCI